MKHKVQFSFECLSGNNRCIMTLFLSLFVAVFVVLFLFKIYIKLTTGWCRSHTCLLGKTAIITGANTGIGYETAFDFAKRGARVILACRDELKGENARTKIIQETGNENIVVKLVDMSSFDSVKAFAQDINTNEEFLHILVNNAGIAGFGKKNKKTEDGHDLIMQINFFSSFLLTNLLIDLLKKSKPSRIVNVSSVAATWADLNLNNIDFQGSQFNTYASSKLCNILFTMELAERLEGTGVTAYSLHPGVVKTEIFRDIQGFKKLMFYFVLNLFFKTSEEGAQTTIFCSVVKGIEMYNGGHFADCQKMPTYKSAKVPQLPKKLWELTEGIVN